MLVFILFAHQYIPPSPGELHLKKTDVTVKRGECRGPCVLVFILCPVQRINIEFHRYKNVIIFWITSHDHLLSKL